MLHNTCVQASGRRKLLQNPAARARAARQRAAAEAQVTPAQLVDALKTRLAAYDEYVAMKAQVASLARLYQVRAEVATDGTLIPMDACGEERAGANITTPSLGCSRRLVFCAWRGFQAFVHDA